MLKGDITGCYDNISHDWMLKNIPMDGDVLRKWLKVGYIEANRLYPTRKGTPQGGIISPCFANMALDGLERVIRESVPRRSRVNFVRYADDFTITGQSRQILENQKKPAVEAFLSERGLTLSPEKTKITYIKDGFTFFGQTFRKHGRSLNITPAIEGVLAFIRKVGEKIRTHVSVPMPVPIKKLNQVLRGWGNYHRHVVASETFCRIGQYVYEQLWRMLRSRHQNKSNSWLAKKYWLTSCGKWVFTASGITKKSKRLRNDKAKK